MTEDSIPGRDKRFLYSAKRLNRFWGPQSLIFNGYRGFLSGVKRPGPEFDHPPDAWSYTSAPTYAFIAWCLIKRILTK
jgi:hypothetical protein